MRNMAKEYYSGSPMRTRLPVSSPQSPLPGDRVDAAADADSILPEATLQAEVRARPTSATARPPGLLLDRSILVVDDTSEVALLVAEQLREIVRNVAICGDGRSALETVKRESIDLIVLDLMLPELSGLEVCSALRTSGAPTLILMLTAKATELDRIVGLEFGADDYMVKPFSALELVARVKALFRRQARRASTAQLPERPIEVAGLLIDPAARQVLRSGVDIALTEKEFDLLYLFASKPGRVFSRSQLLDLVWGCGNGIYEYTVTSHISRLRSKIEHDPANPRIIQTAWGVGYRLAQASCTSKDA